MTDLVQTKIEVRNHKGEIIRKRLFRQTLQEHHAFCVKHIEKSNGFNAFRFIETEDIYDRMVKRNRYQDNLVTITVTSVLIEM